MKTILAVLMVITFSGCAVITYEDQDGAKFAYRRIGAQSITGLDVRRDKTGIKSFKVQGNKGDMGQMAEVITTLAGMAAKTQTP